MPRDFDIFSPDSWMNPVDVHVVRDLVRRSGRNRSIAGQNQGMEIDDVLTDEMNLLGVGRRQKLLEAARLAPGACLTAVEVVLPARRGSRPAHPATHRSTFPGRIRDRDAEVGRIT